MIEPIDVPAMTEGFEVAQRLDEEECHKPEEDASQAHLDEEDSAEGGDRRQGRVEVGDPQGRRHLVPDDTRHEGRKEDAVAERAHEEHFHAEDGTGNGCPEDGGEAGADPADDQPPPVLVVEPEDVGEERRQARPDLRARALLPRRP